MSDTRIERDSMGEMQVPAEALYGAQTARALTNFPISGLRFPRPFLRALGMIKERAARVNMELGLLDRDRGSGDHGSGGRGGQGRTGRAVSPRHLPDRFGDQHQHECQRGDRQPGVPVAAESGGGAIHPNDHVNLGQSSNDVIPTALHMAAAMEIRHTLVPALHALQEALGEKAEEFDDIVKIGRTHLQDAVPVRLGQVFSGYARQIVLGKRRLESAEEGLLELPLGGTAVGTGLNTHPEFAGRVIAGLAK